MNSATCPDCSKVFSRRDVMLRHWHNKDLGDKFSQVYPQSNEAGCDATATAVAAGGFYTTAAAINAAAAAAGEYTCTVLQHPFKMMIIGPRNTLKYLNCTTDYFGKF